MIEKVNPAHPDKLADRIAGAIVDLAYTKAKDPRIAVEVLIGHKQGLAILETSENITVQEIDKIKKRLAPDINLMVSRNEQDPILAKNQDGLIRCGDNGIFLGMPLTDEERILLDVARRIYNYCPTDGKYILDGDRLIICQSCASIEVLNGLCPEATDINPLGYWTGGPDTDSGATNRKLGSDMGHSVTGGGLHGKDLSKADVSVNIYAFLKAQSLGEPVKLSCAIGDEYIDGRPFSEIVEIAREYISGIGGFEKFAEWGLL